MRVTVAVSTWNRAQLLQRTLARMCDLRVPAGVDWELILVNNNSSDTTEQVATSSPTGSPFTTSSNASRDSRTRATVPTRLPRGN